MIILFLSVMGELASLRGLKLVTALMIRLEVAGRERTRMANVLRVASTIRGSLYERIGRMVSQLYR